MKLNANGDTIAYTCPISDVKVPKNYLSTISGNNIDGVIVTVDLSRAPGNTEN